MSNNTLHPDFKSNEPYLWLKGDDNYQLPQEWLDNMTVPEVNSIRIVSSFDEAGQARAGAFIGPVFSDPDYGLLSLAEREFIGVVVSSANSCVTCLIIHGNLLGKLIGNHGRARRIAVNYRTVDLSAQERAIADYCEKLTLAPNKMEPADVQKLRDVGLSDAKIFYIIEVAGVFNLTNRLTSGYGMRPDDDYMQSIAPVV